MARGIGLITPGGNGSLANGFFLPILSDGLEYCGWFGAGADIAAQNFAPEKAAPTIVGAPVFGDGFASFNGGVSYIQTDVTETAAMTAIFIGRNTDTMANGNFRPAFVSNQRGPAVADAARTPEGFAMTTAAAVAGGQSRSLQFFSGRWSGSAANTGLANVPMTNPQIDDWFFALASADSGSRRLWVPKIGALTSQPIAIARDPGTQKMRVGSSYNANLGNCDMICAYIWSRVLSPTEEAAIYANVAAIVLDEYGVAP